MTTKILRSPDEILGSVNMERQKIHDRVIKEISKELEAKFTGHEIKIKVFGVSEANVKSAILKIKETMIESNWKIKIVDSHLATDQRDDNWVEFSVSPVKRTVSEGEGAKVTFIEEM